MKYNYLKEIYPKYISKDDFIKICHTSRRVINRLMDNGKISYSMQYSKTLPLIKYLIPIESAITFLENRDRQKENPDYEKIINEYPLYINQAMMAEICQTSRNAIRWLLRNGIVPCEPPQRGKDKSYSIYIMDVIDYLKEREIYGNMIPKGAINPWVRKEERKEINKQVDDAIIAAKSKAICYSKDLIPVDDAKWMLNLYFETIYGYINESKIKTLRWWVYYLIPRTCLLEFIESQEYRKIVKRNLWRCYHE